MKNIIITVCFIVMAIALGVLITTVLQTAGSGVITRTVTDIGTVNP